VSNVLVVVNDLQDCDALAAELASLHARQVVRIYLLAVQVPPTGHASSFLRGVDLKRSLRQQGLRALRPLRERLDADGTPYRHHVEIGPWLDVIGEFAIARGCRRVLIGDNRASALRNLVLRHDRWKIAAHLGREGLACAVMQLVDTAVPVRASIGPAVRERP
jgi:hypothetical protein